MHFRKHRGSSGLISQPLATKVYPQTERWFYGFTDLYPSIYFFSCATTAKACLMSLLATATIANFPGFPFDRKRSKHALHSVLHRNDAIAPI